MCNLKDQEQSLQLYRINIIIARIADIGLKVKAQSFDSKHKDITVVVSFFGGNSVTLYHS